jgi:hypothetical protein
MRAAAKDLDEMIATWGMTEDEMMEEYKEDSSVCPGKEARCQATGIAAAQQEAVQRGHAIASWRARGDCL